eukprot:scaffold3257_cov67-Phaeocystis_antarctica.AAC.3
MTRLAYLRVAVLRAVDGVELRQRALGLEQPLLRRARGGARGQRLQIRAHRLDVGSQLLLLTDEV